MRAWVLRHDVLVSFVLGAGLTLLLLWLLP